MASAQLPIDRLIHLRRQVLHRYPELSGQESETANQIAAFLSSCHPDQLLKGVGGTGIAAVYNGSSQGPTIMLRCELDALAIEESEDLPHHSLNGGVSHKCGHDGHMTILCGVATLLHHKRPAAGRVILLFQPSEENGMGAAKVLNDAKFQQIKPDWIFALHNLPGFPLNQILVKNGLFTPAVNSIIVNYTGFTAHAAQPEKGSNPALALAELTIELLKLNQATDPDDFVIVTPVFQTMGERAYGVSAGAGESHFTLRCNDTSKMRLLENKAEEIAHAIGTKHNLTTAVHWTEEFYSSSNDENAVNYVRKAARKVRADLKEIEHPFKWGEDFGLFTHRFKGAMFCVGAGEDHPVLHHSDYDFPDKMIETATAVFYETINEILLDV